MGETGRPQGEGMPIGWTGCFGGISHRHRLRLSRRGDCRVVGAALGLAAEPQRPLRDPRRDRSIRKQPNPGIPCGTRTFLSCTQSKQQSLGEKEK
jgi:hypothetical protein